MGNMSLKYAITKIENHLSDSIIDLRRKKKEIINLKIPKLA
jgi:hypothetical protein